MKKSKQTGTEEFFQDTKEPAQSTAELEQGALNALVEVADALTLNDTPEHDAQSHTAGLPEVRPLILGGEDPRDVSLKETVFQEDEMWRGHIFAVNRVTVELPDGRNAERDIIRHPGAVAVVALTDEGRVCLVRQYRASLDRVTLEIPAGKLDPGEDPAACAKRELLEETGMQAKRFGYLTSIVSSVGFTDELIHIYMATGLSFVGSHLDEDEFINVDLVELSELIDGVLDGRIEDAKTVVGALICDAVAHRLEPMSEEQ